MVVVGGELPLRPAVGGGAAKRRRRRTGQDTNNRKRIYTRRGRTGERTGARMVSDRDGTRSVTGATVQCGCCWCCGGGGGGRTQRSEAEDAVVPSTNRPCHRRERAHKSTWCRAAEETLRASRLFRGGKPNRSIGRILYAFLRTSVE